ncbi:MAG: hypothetical protein AAF414_14245 [Pseudomonadota bacterium]
MTIKLLTRALLAMPLAALLLTPLQADAQFRYERGVQDQLSALGIAEDDVIEVSVYPYPDPRDQFGGAQAWVKVEQCPEGSIVVVLSRTGQATYAYGRDGCMIPGQD